MIVFVKLVHAEVRKRSMERVVVLAICTLLATFMGSALADDAADCDSGIQMIKAEIEKTPKEPSLGKLKRALEHAEREKGEYQYDECLKAVEDAKEALK
jgi:hypothetical protein